MKEKILYFFLISIIFSCNSTKDDIVQEPDARKREINFTLSGAFSSTSELANVSTNLDTLKRYVKEIEYRCYNSSGDLVSKETQLSNAENFGTIKDQLADGEYDIVFYGSSLETSWYNDNNGENLKSSLYFRTYNTFYPNGSMHADTRAVDCFSYKAKIVVKEGYTPPPIVLERITGRLEVQILDDIPQSVAELKITAATHERYYPFNLNNEIKSRIHTIAITNHSRKLYSTYIMPLPDSLLKTNVKLQALNATGSILGEKMINDVEIRANYRTILKGKLFTKNENGSSFSVKIDTTNLGIYDEIQY